jgi:hypothetical protein
MNNSSHGISHHARLSYFAEASLILVHIRDMSASGRLSLRNRERTGLAHFYFNAARLVHVTGDKVTGEAVLQDVLSWSRGHVRFDPAAAASREDLTWQQAEIFTRWVSLLEMHGVVHGVARHRLEGLAQHLTARLPGKPIALPSAVEHYEEYKEAARIQQWQQLGDGVQQLIERVLPEEHREQLARVSQNTMQQVSEAVQ